MASPPLISCMKYPSWLIYLVLALAIAAVYGLSPAVQDWVGDAWQALSQGEIEPIRRWVKQQGAWGPIVLGLAFTAQMFLVVVPSLGLMLICVLLYGPWWGAAICIVGMMTASMVGYGLGRSLGRASLNRIVGQGTRQQLQPYIAQYGLWTVILFRLIPFLSNDAISFVAGFMQMGLRRFLLGTLLGIVPLTTALAWVGRDREQLDRVLYGLAALLILSAVGYFLWQRHQTRKPDSK